MYHGIILCGSRNDSAGRNIAGYRLRTAAEKFNYNNLVIDCATAMTEDELELLLSNVITNKTLFLGISTVWLDQPRNQHGKIQWINSEFFNRIRAKYPMLKLVAEVMVYYVCQELVKYIMLLTGTLVGLAMIVFLDF